MDVYLATIKYSAEDWTIKTMILRNQLEVVKDESHYLVENYPKWEDQTYLNWVLHFNENTYEKVYIVNDDGKDIVLDNYEIDGEKYYYQKAKAIMSNGHMIRNMRI